MAAQTQNLPVNALDICVVHPDRKATSRRERWQGDWGIIVFGVCAECAGAER